MLPQPTRKVKDIYLICFVFMILKTGCTKTRFKNRRVDFLCLKKEKKITKLLCFCFDTEEARLKYLRVCVPLTKAALRGDWGTAKVYIDKDRSILTTGITKECRTVLHLAAGTGCVHFVEQLVGMMTREELELRDGKGNTAMCFAAINGSVQVAEILLAKNKLLATTRGGQGMTPLYMAVLFGRSEMAWLLYSKTVESFEEKDRIGIFFTSIDSGLYGMFLLTY